MNPSYPLNKGKAYWLLQVLGWSSMASIAILNHAILMGSPAPWQFMLIQFCAGAMGLVFSHIYKKTVLKPGPWKKPFYIIFLSALQAILILTLAMSLVALLIIYIQAPDYVTPISLLVQVLNFGIFVAPWVTIYFIYKIFNVNQEITEDKILALGLTKTSELELLKSQLNPHFLFNALNSIKALVLINGKIAEEAINKLVELLKFTLEHQKDQMIPLSFEIEEVNKYLDLEKIRFGNRLIFSINLAHQTNNTLIPPAMVLTLVENAIKHGITQLPEGGEISIRSCLKEDKLMVQVKNSGQYHVKRLNGIGLKNIQNRLRFLYGETASFHISNLDEKSVMASICFPLEIENKEEPIDVGEPFTLEQT